MNKPTDGLARFQSIKTVSAGEITEVVAAGCYVKEANGTAVFREYQPGMTVRYTPVVGDVWVVYDGDGYQSISPRKQFEDGYRPSEPSAVELGAAVRRMGFAGP